MSNKNTGLNYELVLIHHWRWSIFLLLSTATTVLLLVLLLCFPNSKYFKCKFDACLLRKN